MRNTSVVIEAENYKDANFLGDFEDYCIIDKEDCELEQKPIIHQFYFVKFDGNFIDPSLAGRIERLEILKECIIREKNLNLHKIESLKEQIATKNEEFRDSHTKYYESVMKKYYQEIVEHWPECVKDDPEEAMDLEMKEAKIAKSIKNLRYKAGHGNRKIKEQTRVIRELEQMQNRREELERQVKQGEVDSPPWIWKLMHVKYYENYAERGSKYKLGTRMQHFLEKKREFEATHKRIIESGWKKVIEAEKRLSFINQKQTRVCNHILKAENKLQQQISCYDGYMALKKKVDELATEKDLRALEQLSSLQVEGFMQRWTRDDEFRANYNRSVCSNN